MPPGGSAQRCCANCVTDPVSAGQCLLLKTPKARHGPGLLCQVQGSVCELPAVCSLDDQKLSQSSSAGAAGLTGRDTGGAVLTGAAGVTAGFTGAGAGALALRMAASAKLMAGGTMRVAAGATLAEAGAKAMEEAWADSSLNVPTTPARR